MLTVSQIHSYRYEEFVKKKKLVFWDINKRVFENKTLPFNNLKPPYTLP
jgi:hypothetical protein